MRKIFLSSNHDKSHHIFDPQHIDILESKERKAQLDPQKIFTLLGVKSEDIVADLGAGSGYFTMPLSNKVKSVYAIDIQQEMLDYLKQKIKENKILNIDLLLSKDPNQIPLPDQSIDFLLTVNTLHEFPDKEKMIKEIKRILKPKGKTGIIDFKKIESTLGPPLAIRVSQKDAIKLFEKNGLTNVSIHSVGSNYLLIFQK